MALAQIVREIPGGGAAPEDGHHHPAKSPLSDFAGTKGALILNNGRFEKKQIVEEQVDGPVCSPLDASNRSSVKKKATTNGRKRLVHNRGCQG